MIKPTRQSLVMLLALSPATLIGIAAKDIVLLIPSIAIAIAMIGDYSYLVYVSKRIRIEVLSSIESIKMWTSEKRILSLQLKVNRCRISGIELQSQIAKLTAVRIASNSVELVVEVSPPYYGRYRLGMLRISITSALGMYIYVQGVELRIEVIVYPRAWRLALIALGLLHGLTTYTEGSEIPTYIRSLSGIYYTTREYTAGDPLARIDWKASARLLKIMVKEFREEMGGGLLLLYDDVCLGPYTCDVVASTALSIAISSFASSIPIALYLTSRRGLVAKDPRDVLLALTKLVFEMLTIPDVDPYELLPPATRDEIKKLLGVSIPSTEVGIENVLERFKITTIVTSLVHRATEIVRLAEYARSKGVELEVYVPRKPWIDSDDIEHAYTVYTTYRLALSKLRSVGCRVNVVG